MTTIAGHTFEETPDGRKSKVCGKKFVDIAGVTEDQIEKTGWAHSGTLTRTEFKEIKDEVNRLWEVGKGA
jgi:rubredoxin